MSSVTEVDFAMDTPRAHGGRQKQIRRYAYGAFGVAVVLVMGLAISRLRPAAPAVERSTVWVDTVRHGTMLREVRGLGSLVPETSRWAVAATNGRVESVLVQPGMQVDADTVLFQLSNPELEAANLEAQSQVRAAEARTAELRAHIETERLDQEAALARLEAEYRQARLKADADRELAAQGLIANLTLRLSTVVAEELQNRSQLQRTRLQSSEALARAQLAVQQAEVDQRRAANQLRSNQYQALRVRPGIAGVLEQVLVEVGSDVAAGANLARVVQPRPLKAVVKIPETEARDLRAGQAARITIHNSEVRAHVSRLDPTVRGGTVTVDLSVDGSLPQGARPDLSVEGTIELERLDDVLYIGRPVAGKTNGDASLFRLDQSSRDAVRTKVRLGRASATTIEVLEGLAAGDQVILSDTSAWDNYDRIRLK
jgi:HlyD family secretion protein